MVGALFVSAPVVQLVDLSGAVGLAFAGDGASGGKPFVVDFLSPRWRQRLQAPLGRRHIFRRALGEFRAGEVLLDATAGFGEDLLVALALGWSVIGLERSPLVHAVLADGVRRAQESESGLAPLFARLTLLQLDAVEYLRRPPVQPVRVVYLDPMFDKPKRSAKSPKAMQLLQALLGVEPPVAEAELFAAAWARAAERLVVKRPLKAKALSANPNHSFKGQSIRYDVYVKAKR